MVQIRTEILRTVFSKVLTMRIQSMGTAGNGDASRIWKGEGLWQKLCPLLLMVSGYFYVNFGG